MHYCGKVICFCFASKQPDLYLDFFTVVLSKSSPGFLKVIFYFSLIFRTVHIPVKMLNTDL